MVRAVLHNGEIRPLGPLPLDWGNGQKLLIEIDTAVSPEEISAWAKEIEEAANAIPEEDHQSFLKALAEQKAISKMKVQQQMDLP